MLKYIWKFQIILGPFQGAVILGHIVTPGWPYNQNEEITKPNLTTWLEYGKRSILPNSIFFCFSLSLRQPDWLIVYGAGLNYQVFPCSKSSPFP